MYSLLRCVEQLSDVFLLYGPMFCVALIQMLTLCCERKQNAPNDPTTTPTNMVMEAVPTDSAVALESRAGAKAPPSSAGGDPQTFTCTDGDGADKEKPSGNPTKGSREGLDEVGTAEVVTAKLQKVLKKKQRDPTDVDTEETKYERRRRKRRVRSLEEESTQPWIGSCEDFAEQNHPTQDSQQGSRASSPERRNEKIEMPGWTVEQITQSLMSQRRFEEMTTAKPPKSPLRDRDQYRSTGTSAAASPAKSPMKGSAEGTSRKDDVVSQSRSRKKRK